MVSHLTKNCLVMYSGELIKTEGEIVMRVKDQDMKFQVSDKGSAIIGKEGCVALGLVQRVCAISKSTCQDEEQCIPVINVQEPSTHDLVNKYRHFFWSGKNQE